MPVPGWTILCDFDGTISVEDVIDSLLDRFGR
ncbi:MAG: phosphatase, partial [Rhodanobacter sp.]